MDTMGKVHNVPVPERFLPLVHKVLADAYAAELAANDRGDSAPDRPPEKSVAQRGWTREEVVDAYRESSLKQRAILDYLARNPDRWVPALELAREVYPGLSDKEAWDKLNGSLGAFGTRVNPKYGHEHWFFGAKRETRSDGSRGTFIYCMPPEKANWLQEASSRG